MRYIWFLTGEQAERIRVRVMVEYGYGRFVNPDLLEKFGYDDILRKVPASWRKTFDQAMKYGVPEPYGKNTQFIYTKVSEPINWALQNEQLLDLPREQALARLEDRLDSAAERVDRYMLGKLTPEQWRFRRIVGTIALCLIIGLFGGSLYYVWRAFTKAEVTSDRRPSLWRFAPAYLMLAPALAIVLLWQYLPVIMSLPLALCDYELVIASEFVGIDNFATVLFDERFWASLARTCYYVLLVVGLGFWPPIFVAILLDEVPTAGAKYFFRTVFYLPAIVSGVIMVFLWLQLYQPDEDGVLNQIILLVNHLGPVGGTLTKLLLLGAWLGLIGLVLSMVFHLRELTVPVRLGLALFGLGLLLATIWPLVEAYLGPTEVQAAAMIQQGVNPTDHQGLSAVFGALSHLVGRWNLSPLRWVEDPALAMVCVVIPGIWAHAGPGCIIYLAALKTVPDELVEAATIDGAGILQKIAYITLPRIKFLILIQLVGAIVSAFKGGTNFILAMTGGGPQTPTGGATKVLGMDIFERTFMELNYGVGAAMAWLLGGLVIIVTAYQLKRISRAEFKTADTAKENPGGTPYTAPAGAR
jgi:multiple sugar transport system permease protein